MSEEQAFFVIEEQERKERLGKMLMKGHYPYFTLMLTKALTSLDMLTSVWLSHAHLLLQLGGKAGADGDVLLVYLLHQFPSPRLGQ